MSWPRAAREAHALAMLENTDPDGCTCLWAALLTGRVTDETDPIPIDQQCAAHAYLLEIPDHEH